MSTNQNPVDALSEGLDEIRHHLSNNEGLGHHQIAEELEAIETEILCLYGEDQIAGGSLSECVRNVLSELTDAEDRISELEAEVEELRAKAGEQE